MEFKVGLGGDDVILSILSVIGKRMMYRGDE